MLTLAPNTAALIKRELESIPEKYHKAFNSPHEALGVIREEYLELEQEIFFGEKKAKQDCDFINSTEEQNKNFINTVWKERMKKEAAQVAAMCARLIQEL